MNIKLMHPADQIVTMMERIYGYGMTTTSGGNLSIMDENGDIWITPSGIDKGSLTREDIMCVKPDGTVIGPHTPSIELPFHSTIYKRRPDVKAILHAHPPALVSFSIVGKIPNTKMIPNVDLICGDVEMAPYDLPGSMALGEKIAKVYENSDIKTVMMENHGVIVADNDLFSAFMAFETLEYCAKLEINARTIGEIRQLEERHIKISKEKNKINTIGEFEVDYYTSQEREARQKMCDLVRRSYRQKLFTSTQGTFSQRIDGNNFIITPYGVDRDYLNVEDIVRIQDGKAEKGKRPSRSWGLHEEIYRQHPEINSIIIAHPYNIMAFAVTGAEFDSRTIPESYIALRNVPKLPFGSSFMQPKLTAKEINPSTPVVLVENDCIITTGVNLIKAFDCLEVAEYSAKAIITSNVLGKINQINDKQVEEINEAFHLK